MVIEANSTTDGGCTEVDTDGVWCHCLLGAKGTACIGTDSWAEYTGTDGWVELDSASPEGLYLPSLLLEGTKAL